MHDKIYFMQISSQFSTDNKKFRLFMSKYSFSRRRAEGLGNGILLLPGSFPFVLKKHKNVIEPEGQFWHYVVFTDLNYRFSQKNLKN